MTISKIKAFSLVIFSIIVLVKGLVTDNRPWHSLQDVSMNSLGQSPVDADGDYAPLQVDENGRLKVVADIEVANGHEKLEDAAHSSGDVGSFVLAVRQDTLINSTDTDGDYAAFKVNQKGELYTHDVDANSSLDNIETELQSLSHVEDSAHSSGHSGVMPLAVRRDADTSLVDSDGDYAPLQVDSLGRLKTRSIQDAIGSENYTVTDDLAAAGDGLISITAAATPWITVASLAVGSGVTAYLYGWDWGCDQNAQARIVTDDTIDVKLYKTALNSSSNPSYSSYWNEGGRIEIPGAASLEVKLQIKKRSDTGGNANGHGSLHIRTL